jgi:hypothetical protein
MPGFTDVLLGIPSSRVTALLSEEAAPPRWNPGSATTFDSSHIQRLTTAQG